MILLIVFAFLAGFFTVLSPCILPILPAILSASSVEGKKRPLGIILGLIGSFSFFTLTLTAITEATHLSVNVLRYLAIALILCFGLVMLFPRVSGWFAKITAPLADLGQKIQGKQSKSGFWGGILLGLALGLLWTPCAGPILAAITTLVATHAVTIEAILLTLSYSLGAGIPLFLIAYGGNRVINSSRFLSKYAEKIRQFFGIVMILIAISLFFHWEMLVEQKLIRYVSPTFIENNEQVKKRLQQLRGASSLPMMGYAPELVGIDGWINSEPLKIADLKGKVVLIDFWTYSCINCIRTLPYLEKWYAKYKTQGFVVIGVHTPEFEFEKNFKNVEEAAKDLGVHYPIALDNHYQTWNAYHNYFWPAHFLIDQEGRIRMEHFGEGAYVETENAIRQLLGLSPLAEEEGHKPIRPITHEVYLGKERGYTLSYAEALPENAAGVKGTWEIGQESILAQGNDCYLGLNFQAKQVYLVLSGRSATPVQVFLDGKKVSEFIVDEDRKYDIVDTSYSRHQLLLKIPLGIRAYAFTFGDE